MNRMQTTTIEEIEIEQFIKENKSLSNDLLKKLNSKLKEKITKTFMFKGLYENLWSKKTIKEPVYKLIEFDINKHLYCGKVSLDFRVFDRDPIGIDRINKNGLKSNNLDGQEYTLQEARDVISKFSGIGIFRENFKIRPYGDKGNDWLGLDKRRVNNPSLKIGKNQIIGFVKILSEEESHLEENSARNGLKENNHYTFLQDSLLYVLSELEDRRFDYRERTGKSRIKSSEDIIKKALSYSSTRDKLSGKLKQLRIEKNKAKLIEDFFKKEDEKREEDINELRKIIAKYQGQVTLGKIISIVLHEGRRPLSYIKNQVPIMNQSIKEIDFKENDIIFKLDLEGLFDNGNLLISLFNKIEPLSVKKRGKMKEFSLKKVVDEIIKIFQESIIKSNITIKMDIEINNLMGWKDDFIMIFANLFDNSIYWFEKYPSKNQVINIKSFLVNDKITIIYEDNGIGIEEDAIYNNKLFEPGYSTKPEGTGLGVSIAGEAASRNGYELKAEYKESGAYFILTKLK